jgi:acetylornithine deacetylase/succinyl-diaminopimelate desuccinylase-like protein
MASAFDVIPSGTENHVITLTDGAVVRGRLVENGKPVGNAEVGLIGRPRGGYGANLQLSGYPYEEIRIGTQRDGRFVITNVPVLPHRALAKIDMRLVPDMTAAGTLALLKEHLAKHGFGDIEVNMSGGYDPTLTSQDSKLIQAQIATYRKLGLDPVLWPRSAGSWPGYIFTSEPLNLPAGHFGVGHGTGAHAPNEYYLIDSTNAKVAGMDGAVRSFVEYLYALA